MSLTDFACRGSVPHEKDYKLSDGEGLYLLVKKSGSKCWRMNYRYAGKSKTLAFGVYPDISLRKAREKRGEARSVLREGIDPSLQKKEEAIKRNISNSLLFGDIAREWHEMNSDEWSPRRSDRIIKLIEKDLAPSLGNYPIGEITALILLATLKKIEKRGVFHTTKIARATVSRIFRYAIVTGRAERDIAADLVGAFKTKRVVHNSYLNEDELPEFFERLEELKCNKTTKLALDLMILCFSRTNELRGALWSEVNFKKCEWRIPPERMKARRMHIVPLSKQAISLLKKLEKLTGDGDYLFPNGHKRSKNKTMTENAMLYALYRMGYKGRATIHGFRSTASTILNENGFYPDVIERQLAHLENNQVRASYNHAQHLPERCKMMQWYADYLDTLKNLPS